MSLRHLIVPVALFVSPAIAGETVGAFGTWAAFCEQPRKCFAIARPDERRDTPFLSVAFAGPTPTVRAHVGQPVRKASLRIGGVSFGLQPSGLDAAADGRMSRRIVAAIRAADTLNIAGTTADGGRFRHHYALAGAPSAIDSAAIASAR